MICEHLLANYEDLRNAYGKNYTKALIHYLRHGIKEGRNGITSPNTPEPSTAQYTDPTTPEKVKCHYHTWTILIFI